MNKYNTGRWAGKLDYYKAQKEFEILYNFIYGKDKDE